MNWLLRLLVKYKARPDDVVARLHARNSPICYVLEQRSSMDLAVLQDACVRLKLPRPRKRLLEKAKDLRSFFYLSQARGFWDERLDRRTPTPLRQMIDAMRADPTLDIDLVPVAVYWSRAPQKERSWFRLLFVEDWALATRARRFMQVLVNGRNALIEFDDPISLRGLLGEQIGVAVRGRRVTRTLRGLYAKHRAARIGPDLSHRRTIVTSVLRTRAVRAVLAQEKREKKLTRGQAIQRAKRFAEEIAANYSHSFIRFMESALSRLWNRLYDGVVFGHVETLERTAEGNEIVYVPCHRSHMDYLLLSYVIYVNGFAIPHIAAGINLNLPIVGRFLRMGGAFFIRRSFRGNALYTVVFMKYLAAIMARGHSIEYFIEGGRSRTGRLLQPKTGMLSMTLRSFLRDPARPVVFMPVYFGYERIVEGNTYIGELSGKAKEKESVLGLLRAARKLRERFGKVHVNLGEPIALADLLDQYEPNWRGLKFEDDTRAPWVGRAVDALAGKIMRNINSAAAVTPIGLLAVTLLATPRQALPEADLMRQLDLYRALLRGFTYSDRVTATELTSAEILAYGISMKVVSRESHGLGDIVRMSDESAILATYYRNNILHLFAMPSLAACVFASNARVRTEDIQRLAWRIYPYIAAELFLRWDEQELPQVVDKVLACLEQHGLIECDAESREWQRPPPNSAKAVQLSLLAQATIQTIERYYLAIAQLLKAGSGQITQAALEERCQLTAQRMAMLYGLNSPEFFDRAMFSNFIDLLRARQVIRNSAAGKLEFDEVLIRVAADAQFVLSEQLRHSILQVTPHIDSADFRRFGHELIDWIADYREKAQAGAFPVLSSTTPGTLKAQLPAAAPAAPEPFESVMHDLTQQILPACAHFQSPAFYGYFPSNSSFAAVLGDYASTGLAQLGLNWQSSPALTELEEVTTDWLRQMLGLTPAWSGVIQDTASTTTLVALLSARERTTDYGAARGGLQESDQPLVVYVSSQSHSSVDKAALLAGFGRNNIHVIPVDSHYAMRTDVLAETIESDRARGLLPCAVVATVGSTATTAVDPLADIAKVARSHGLWLHVDAAMAGSAMILPECRPLWLGVEEADSLVTNPHKWLGASFDCSLYFVRDPQHLVRVMSTNPSYLRTAADAQVKNFRDWGIPLGRRFRALKLWFLIREQGVSGLQARLRRDIGNAQWLAAQIDATPHWKRVAPAPLQTVCVRHEPPGLSGEALDTHTLAWVRRINESGKAYLTPAVLDGRWMVRVSVGAEATERHHVEQLWALMREEAARGG